MAAASAITVERDRQQFQGIFDTVWKVKGTLNVSSLVDAAGETNTVAVPGVALGDMVLGISASEDLVGVTVTGYVSAANVVSLRFQNESGSTFDGAATAQYKLVVARPAF